jgi:hypothetical protein
MAGSSDVLDLYVPVKGVLHVSVLPREERSLMEKQVSRTGADAGASCVYGVLVHTILQVLGRSL